MSTNTDLATLNTLITEETAARGKGGSRPLGKTISTGFWSIQANEELEVNDKYLLVYLITNRYTNLLGLYEMPSVRQIAFETGLSVSQVKESLESLQKNRIIELSATTNEVLLYGWLKYGVNGGGGSVCQRLLADADAVKDTLLIQMLLRHCDERFNRYSPTIRVFLALTEERLREQGVIK